MTTFISRYRERQIKRSIRKRFNSPIPPDSKRYPHDKPAPPLTVSEFLAALFTQFFTLFAVVFQFNAPQVFRKLRKHWNINEEEYQKSFQEPLETISGNKGLSGASFFITKNQKYLIKSLDRKFEWEYYYEHLLMPLSKYQLSHPESEIVHMTDALFNFAPRLGRILRTSPSNFLIMENSREGEGWEDYDLKPTNYFYPERDFLGGKLTSQEHKERLHDIFEGHIDLHAKEYEKLMKSLEEDAQFLSDMEAIDYSLFVIRRKHGKYDGTLTFFTTDFRCSWSSHRFSG